VGQAKNRGTFEERKAQAFSKKQNLTPPETVLKKKRPRHSNALMLAAAFGIAAATKENK
jgi:hypothetical protein